MADAFTIDDAYKAIPHSQTPYDMKQSRLPNGDSKYLDHFFFVSDMAMRARVLMLQKLYHGRGRIDIDEYNAEIDKVLASFALINTPPHLQQVEDVFVDAIKDQQRFFNDWAETSRAQAKALRGQYTKNPLVQSSHRKLLQAYSLLKQQYPSETQHNQKAFFDHLCALDFI